MQPFDAKKMNVIYGIRRTNKFKLRATKPNLTRATSHRSEAIALIESLCRHSIVFYFYFAFLSCVFFSSSLS